MKNLKFIEIKYKYKRNHVHPNHMHIMRIPPKETQTLAMTEPLKTKLYIKQINCMSIEIADDHIAAEERKNRTNRLEEIASRV